MIIEIDIDKVAQGMFANKYEVNPYYEDWTPILVATLEQLYNFETHLTEATERISGKKHHE